MTNQLDSATGPTGPPDEGAPLSFVVPIHGELEATRRFLTSFDRQTRSCPLRFVDDRSPDDSVAWLRSRGRSVEVPEERLWFNGILNRAIANCQTPLLGVLNNDLVLGRRFVDLVVEAFEQSDYDILVPLTVEGASQQELDREHRFRIATLWRREGWCMLFRLASVRKLPPVPDDLRLYFGDTWLFHHAWEKGLKVGVMLHNRILHERSRTIAAVQDKTKKPHPVIAEDEVTFREKYSWVEKRRKLGWIHLIPRPLRKIMLPHY